jgi:hypothetical protein
MKAKSPVVIALVLWFLYWATNAFAGLKSPYPQKADPPGQIIAISDSGVASIVATAIKPK